MQEFVRSGPIAPVLILDRQRVVKPGPSGDVHALELRFHLTYVRCVVLDNDGVGPLVLDDQSFAHIALSHENEHLLCTPALLLLELKIKRALKQYGTLLFGGAKHEQASMTFAASLSSPLAS